jgi:hypothetical protein
MGYKTREKNGISKIIVDIPEKDHIKFKTICRARGYTIKETIHQFIKHYNDGKINFKV